MAPTTTSAGLARFGSLLADPTRTEILCALLDGRAYTNSELGRHAGVAASTVSEHLSKLLDGGLVVVEAQGRHRYWRLVDDELAAALEQLVVMTTSPPRPRPPGALVNRSCYDHLAGELAVEIFDGLIERRMLVEETDRLTISDAGYRFFDELGVDTAAIRQAKRPKARSCLDWTQRRHHLAGESGKQLLGALIDHGWVRRGKQPRSIEITRAGRAELPAAFAVSL